MVFIPDKKSSFTPDASKEDAPAPEMDVRKYYADPKNRRNPIQDAAALAYGAGTGLVGIPGALESLGRTGLRAVGADVSDETVLPTPQDVRSTATKYAGFPSMEGDPRITVGEFLPAVGPTIKLVGQVPNLVRALKTLPGVAPVAKYFGQSGVAKDASEALRVKALSSVENAAKIGEEDVSAALREAQTARMAPITTPAIQARNAQYRLAETETASARAAQETAKKQAAALQALEDQKVIKPVGTPATYEAIGSAPQAEMLAAKAAREAAASKAWKNVSTEVDAIDASKQGFGTRIAYTKPFKDFINFATKEANAPAGSPQTKVFYKKILQWFPKGNINAIKPSDVMELKRFIAEEANAPAQGFKAIGKERADAIYKQLDNILENHLTNAKTGVSPYAQRRDAYSLYKEAWERDYLSRYGKKFTAENVSGDAVSSGTDVARTLFKDPAAMRAAIADGASIPTLLKSTASHVANEFQGKGVDEIVKLLQPRTPLSNMLDNVPELASLRQSVQKYVQQITEQQKAGEKISGFNKTAEDFAKRAAQSEKAAVTAQERVVKGVETRKAMLARQVQKSMDAATARQQGLMDVQQLRGDLSSARVKNNPKEIISLAKSHFSSDQAMLDEIAKIEKMNISAEKMRSLVLSVAKYFAGGGAAGLGLQAVYTGRGD
jgi:hypothetical protein